MGGGGTSSSLRQQRHEDEEDTKCHKPDWNKKCLHTLKARSQHKMHPHQSYTAPYKPDTEEGSSAEDLWESVGPTPGLGGRDGSYRGLSKAGFMVVTLYEFNHGLMTPSFHVSFMSASCQLQVSFRSASGQSQVRVKLQVSFRLVSG